MKNECYFKDKKVTVVGLSRSGMAASILLKSIGSRVKVTDSGNTAELKNNATLLKDKGVKDIELGAHSEDFIRGSDLVVVSPGVNNKSPAIIWAENFKIPIISEIELGFMLCPAKIIATTGTNGKTTVTTLIGKIIEASGRRAFVCGNIGRPFCAELKNITEEDLISLEVSSFQLERIKTFKPYISVILNFTPDHLDRYQSVSDYLEAKKRIFMNQTKDDYVILNGHDNTLRKLEKEILANVRYFKDSPEFNPNQSAVIEVARVLGINRDVYKRVFDGFKGIEHRLEIVRDIDGIEFINDSKATNVDSAFWALRNINKPIILIAGGRDKGIDYSLIADAVKNKVRLIILIGEAREKIRLALGGLVPCVDADSLETAVRQAYSKAASGDCVLLSPMCASFDMFKNYEERGDVFKKIVKGLSPKKIYA